MLRSFMIKRKKIKQEINNNSNTNNSNMKVNSMQVEEIIQIEGRQSLIYEEEVNRDINIIYIKWILYE